jgi:DNA modification methylase
MAKRPKLARPSAGPEMFASQADVQVIYCGDNLEKLRSMPTGMVDLIYIDPPFNSNRNYEIFWGETKEKRAFDDRHASTEAYIEFMRPRCVELRRVLKDTGSFYYHCDWHADAYVRVMLDQIFGETGFNTHVVWRRTTAKSQSFKTFPNNHDSILFYTKGKGHTFNRQFTPHSQERIDKHYSSIERGTGRRYSLGDLTGEGLRNGETGKVWRGFDPGSIGRHWSTGPETLEEYDREGRVYWPGTGGFPRYKRYLDEQPGSCLDSIWTDIPPINARAAERIGYPTQKPLPLLERIIKASSDKDDIVLDAFCGCGTALVAAQNLERRWIGIDISPTACRVMAKRLEDDCKLKERKDFAVRDMPHSEQFLRRIPHFEFESWAVVALGGIPNPVKVGDFGIDGKIFPVSSMPSKDGEKFDFMDHWYPIQVKQKDKAGRDDIDHFVAAMLRAEKSKGFFVSFDFTLDAENEIRRHWRQTGREIVPVKVSQILSGDIPLSIR